MPFRLVHIILLLVAFAGTGDVWGQEEGLASYYHNRFHGRKAASGRVHDADELVAAHRTYPFGTFLRVTNLSNMRRVIVCVTDRGPFRKGRIIDVSAGAAELLGFKKKGLARVRIEVVPGKIDLSLLDLLYPKIPFLEVDHLRVRPPYKSRYIKKHAMAKILLVEDEVNIASFIERGLQEFGHEVRVANDGQAGWELVQQEDFHLLILDIIMPKMNGLQLCKQYRQTYGYQSPVVMLTALGTTDDIVNGLDAGADDYLVKPFSFQELEARIKALLRRTGAEPAVPLLSCGDLTLDPSSHRAIRGKVVIDLTVKEYRLLEYLIQNQGTAQSRLTLLKNVWDKNFDTNTNVVDVYVNYLRSKIDKDFDRKLIRTVVGVGYMMEA